MYLGTYLLTTGTGYPYEHIQCVREKDVESYKEENGTHSIREPSLII